MIHPTDVSESYAVEKLTREEVEEFYFNYMSYEEAVKSTILKNLKTALTLEDGETIYYISNPAIVYGHKRI